MVQGLGRPGTFERCLSVVGLVKTFGGMSAVEDFGLTMDAGEFVTILGPSGCGKTTTIRMIAGYVIPTAGRIALGGRDVTGLPPQRRHMGMVFQDYALFPHLTVRDNVAFGLRMHGVARRERRARADELLELVGLSGFGGGRPSEMSGGMRQRVALARALAIQPRVLLLDEPFSALDANLRVSLRREVQRLQKAAGVTTVLVTHDQEEAFAISDRIVVMSKGRIEQVGTPQEIYHRPTSAFVRDFVGRSTNLVGEIVEAGPGKRLTVRISDAVVLADDPGEYVPGVVVSLTVRPEQVRLDFGDRGPRGSENLFEGVVEAVEFAGGIDRVTLRVEALGARVLSDIASSGASAERLHIGTRVKVSIDPDHVVVLQHGQTGSPSGMLP